MLIPKHDEEYRQELLKLSAQSLFFFERSMLGFKDMNEHFHAEWCDSLQGIGEWGDWRRGMITAARGFLKSTIATIGFPIHAGAFPEVYGLKDHSTRILAASEQNGIKNFMDPIHELFRRSRRSDFLFWLLADRIPPNFDGWTDKSIPFLKFEPTAQDSISLKGMFAKQEGYHGNLIVLDDPEGADAEGSPTTNEDARRAVNMATPLLQRVRRDKILIVATPHGDDPLVFRALRQSFDPEAPSKEAPILWDNSNRVWKQIYVPALDENDKPTWPEILGAEDVKLVRSTVDRRTWDQQYMLRETSTGGGPFDMKAIADAYYEDWVKEGKRIGVKYPVRLVDKKKWEKEHKWEETITVRGCRFDDMRFYLHTDLIHREDTVSTKATGGKRLSKAGFVVVGVSPDFHIFVLSTFTDKVGLDEQLRIAFRYHQEFGLYRATWDSFGAQVWFKKFIEDKERANPAFQRLRSSGRYGEARLLPRLSSIFEEDKRSVRMHKEEVIYERLEGWFSDGTLHLRADQSELIHQVEFSIDSSEMIDLLDALAQGPAFWKPPSSRAMHIRFREQDAFTKAIREKYTGYWSPYRDRLPGGKPDLEPPGGYGLDLDRNSRDATWGGTKGRGPVN